MKNQSIPAGRPLAENNLRNYLEREITFFMEEAECKDGEGRVFFEITGPHVCAVKHEGVAIEFHGAAVNLQNVLDNLNLGGIGGLI